MNSWAAGRLSAVRFRSPLGTTSQSAPQVITPHEIEVFSLAPVDDSDEARRVGSRPSATALDPIPVPRLLVLDFDGVITDNRVLTAEDGQEFVLSDRSDGLGIQLLKGRTVVIVLSSEKNKVVKSRCLKLGVNSYYGFDDKWTFLVDYTRRHNTLIKDVAYVGNDVNDLECLRSVGISIAVADAHPTVLKTAQFVLTRRGGRGALRELADRMQGTPILPDGNGAGEWDL